MAILLCVLSLSTLSSCTKDNGGGGNDNTGIEFRMISNGHGMNEVYFGEYDSGSYYYSIRLWIDSSNNFIVDCGDIASVGSVNNLSRIKNIPETGWVDEIAVHPGYGYVIRYKENSNASYQYARIYVEEWIESTSGGIIGAVLWYEDNWK